MFGRENIQQKSTSIFWIQDAILYVLMNFAEEQFSSLTEIYLCDKHNRKGENSRINFLKHETNLHKIS